MTFWHHTIIVIGHYFVSCHSNQKKVSRIARKSYFLIWWPWPLIYDLDLQTCPKYDPGWLTCKMLCPYVKRFSHESAELQTHTQRRDWFYYLVYLFVRVRKLVNPTGYRVGLSGLLPRGGGGGLRLLETPLPWHATICYFYQFILTQLHINNATNNIVMIWPKITSSLKANEMKSFLSLLSGSIRIFLAVSLRKYQFNWKYEPTNKLWVFTAQWGKCHIYMGYRWWNFSSACKKDCRLILVKYPFKIFRI